MNVTANNPRSNGASHSQSLSVKAPPHNLQAEEAVLGGILLFSDKLDLLTVKPEDFYNGQHAAIFRAILSLDVASLPIDAISVANALSDKDKEGFGLRVFELSDRIPTAANIAYYDEIVKEKARLRELARVAQSLLEEIYSGDLAPDESRELMDRAETEIMQIRQNDSSVGGMVKLSDMTRDYFQQLEQVFEGGQVPSIKTGLTDLDQMTGGLRKGQLIYLAGRPGHGKTSLACQIAAIAAWQGVEEDAVVPIFSLEMEKEELYTQILSQRTGVDSKMLRGEIKFSEDAIPRLFDAATAFENLPVYIGDTVGLTPAKLRGSCRRLKAQHGKLGLVVVDYLQLMKGDGRASNKTDEVTNISAALKELAKELGCPVLCLSQLNRDCEKRPDKRPKASDLRDSGGLEQDADLIMFTYRDKLYNPDTVEKDVAEIIIGKQRKGALGTVYTKFEDHCTRFSDGMKPSY